ncbi:MAG: hypothetical protein ACQEXJ_24435 [Myxococcota bacterium]
MWNRLKALWAGATPAVDEDPGSGGAPERQAAGRPAEEAGPHEEALRAIDRALEEGDTGRALMTLRAVLLDGAAGRAVLERAARLMEALDEAGLAVLFRQAAVGRAAEPLIELAASFLEMDDGPVAVTMARAARRRTRGEAPFVDGLVAEGNARAGDHDAVLEALGGWIGRWPDPALLRRYAQSAVLAGQRAAWDRVAADVAADEEAAWIAQSAAREASFDLDAEVHAPLRHALFVEYGAVLLDAEAVLAGGIVEPGVLAQIMDRATDVIRTAGVEVDRVAHVSQRGEVFAHWMARLLDSTPMPLSARIQGQRILLVAADDDDLAGAAEHRAWADGPALVMQVLKAPGRTGLPAPDLVGLLAEGAALPLSGLEAARAADRVPPRLELSALVKAAEGAETDGAWPFLRDWVRERRDHLAVTRPWAPDERPPYAGDLPAWAFRR